VNVSTRSHQVRHGLRRHDLEPDELRSVRDGVHRRTDL